MRGTGGTSAMTVEVGRRRSQIRQDLWRPLAISSPRYWIATGAFAAVVAWALIAWAYQIYAGIGIAGIRRPTFWAFYIVNFVFWIGISHAGTLISAILRLTGAAWRKPVTRAAEAITVFALMIGGLFPLIHLGRVWRFYWLIPYPNDRLLWPNFRSPLVWDLTAIFTYITGSVLYLYLPMIPDLAELAAHSIGLRARVYKLVSLGWRGSDREWHALERAMKLMAGIILAVAVSVHTVVSWDFAMALTPTWHSTIFGPYFVAGAIFSGIAALVVVMASLRRFLHLEEYLRPVHFDNLGKLLLLMCLVWTYFTTAEHLTIWYGKEPAEYAVLESRIYGPYSPFFWAMVVLNFVVPFLLLGIRRLRNIRTITICGVTVLIGMWLERFLIVVDTLAHPRLASAWGDYQPRWVEISIMAGTFAAMTLGYLVVTRLFPLIAVWEYDDVAHPSPLQQQTRCAVADRPVNLPPVSAASPAVAAEYADQESVAAGVSELAKAGFGAGEVDIFSDRPVELPAGVLDRPSRASLFGVLGAAINGSLATAFMIFTQHNYPLVTGGMPISSPWSTGVVSYELTMAGAVAGVVIAFLWESGLLRRRRPRPPARSEGSIAVRVRCSGDSLTRAEECLSRTGATVISRAEGAA